MAGRIGGGSGTGHGLERVADVAARLEQELSKAIIGQRRVVREILIAFLAGGHCLLRGVPGLAKTLLIKKLAQAVDLKFNRIQFTPDLMERHALSQQMIVLKIRRLRERERGLLPATLEEQAGAIAADARRRTRCARPGGWCCSPPSCAPNGRCDGAAV